MKKLLLQKQDGTEIDLELAGLFLIKLAISSLDPKHETESAEGSDGLIIVDTTLNGREIRAEFLLESNDLEQYFQVRKRVFSIFNGKSYFYLIDSEEPYKRWKVKMASKFTPERMGSAAFLEINFLSPSPYAESVVSTVNPELTDTLYQVETEEAIQYVFDTPTFYVWNNGDILINPRYQWMDMKITFEGASENLTIRNLSTGDQWAYTEASIESDVIILDGIKSSKNGLSIFGKTNRKLITLAPGRNDFEIVGATGPFLISFDFRFYFM